MIALRSDPSDSRVDYSTLSDVGMQTRDRLCSRRLALHVIILLQQLEDTWSVDISILFTHTFLSTHGPSHAEKNTRTVHLVVREHRSTLAYADYKLRALTKTKDDHDIRMKDMLWH